MIFPAHAYLLKVHRPSLVSGRPARLVGDHVGPLSRIKWRWTGDARVSAYCWLPLTGPMSAALAVQTRIGHLGWCWS